MSDYLVPVNADVPTLDAAYLPAQDTKASASWSSWQCPPRSPNGVFNATGRRVTDLPITLEKLL